MFRGSTALLLPLVFSSAMAAEAPNDISGIPHVTISYYDVSGKTEGKIRAAINKQRPIDPADNKPFDGRTSYKYGWGWAVDGDGKCHLENAKVEFEATVTLPRLTDYPKQSKELQQKWDRYINALKDHEFGHVVLAYGQKDRLLAAIRGATCDTANRTAADFLAGLAKLNQDYDRKTQHGIKKGASFP